MSYCNRSHAIALGDAFGDVGGGLLHRGGAQGLVDIGQGVKGVVQMDGAGHVALQAHIVQIRLLVDVVVEVIIA